MFIAVNAGRQPSPFGGADGKLRPTSQVDFRSSERRGMFLLFRAINMSPLQGEERSDRATRIGNRQSVMRRPTRYTAWWY